MKNDKNRRCRIMRCLLLHWIIVLHTHRKNKEIHYNKVTNTSSHYKEVENFVGTEILVVRIKNRQFQCVDNTANRINNATCQ